MHLVLVCLGVWRRCSNPCGVHYHRGCRADAALAGERYYTLTALITVVHRQRYCMLTVLDSVETSAAACSSMLCTCCVYMLCVHDACMLCYAVYAVYMLCMLCYAVSRSQPVSAWLSMEARDGGRSCRVTSSPSWRGSVHPEQGPLFVPGSLFSFSS